MTTCSAASLAAGEPLAATASRIDHWILLEYPGLWNRDVLGGSLLSSAVKSHLREQLAALGRGRLLFVKRPERRSARPRRLFLGCSKPGEERLVAWELEENEEVADIDLAAALSDQPGSGVPVHHPLLVVCTHGKRDRCCATHGRPLYDALRHATDPSRVWQSTHVGGDRFAGNVVVLPEGLYFGRVGPDDAESLVRALSERQIDVARYRGRSAYSFPEQAAEQAVREETGILGIDELSLLDAKQRSAGAWRIGFRSADGAIHEVDVVEETASEPAFLTCGAEEPRLARRYVATARRLSRP